MLPLQIIADVSHILAAFSTCWLPFVWLADLIAYKVVT